MPNVLQWDIIEVSPGEFEIYAKHDDSAKLVTFLNDRAQVKYRVSKEKADWYVEQMRGIWARLEGYGNASTSFNWIYLPKKRE